MDETVPCIKPNVKIPKNMKKAGSHDCRFPREGTVENDQTHHELNP